MPSPHIDPDIRQARTLPGRVYVDSALHDRFIESALARSWQFAGDLDRVAVPGQVSPFTLLPGSLDEPLIFTRDMHDRIHCLSNVCTHRGALVCEDGGRHSLLTCRYHGRRFGLDGAFRSMPEFELVEDFPAAEDNLTAVPWGAWNRFLFAGLVPSVPLDECLAPLTQRLAGWFEHGQLVLDPSRSREYLVRANWILYCDNYLEGFHIPYVHPALGATLSYPDYTVELFPSASLQIGYTKDPAAAFELPPTAPDHGRSVAAYYFWLFPNTMLNIYPWGVSVNVVLPLTVDRTKVVYWAYVADPSRLDLGAGAELDRVEREDEAIVESVQRGVTSRLYSRGRYSPARETAVHHFHRLLSAALTEASGTN